MELLTPRAATGPVGVALIGAGVIAERHVAALSAARDAARLHAIVAPRPERARRLLVAHEGPAPAITDDPAAMAADPRIAMAIVATPPSVRREVIAPLAAAGIHILLEKPVGRDPAEAREIVALCERAGVALGVVFQHRLRPPSRAAARLIEGGGLGRLGLVEIAVPLWRDQSYYEERGRGTYARDGGGVLITNGIHSIDLALSLAGSVARVQGTVATTLLHRMEAEDFATAALRFENGALGSLVAGTAMFPHRTEVVRLHFERASLRIDKDALEVSWRDGRTERMGEVEPSTPRHAWHRAVIEDFVEALREGRAPMASGREALASQELIAAIETSSATGRPVDLRG